MIQFNSANNTLNRTQLSGVDIRKFKYYENCGRGTDVVREVTEKAFNKYADLGFMPARSLIHWPLFIPMPGLEPCA